MMQAGEHPPDPEVIRRGYEASELNIRGLGWSLAIFLLTGVVVFIGVWYLLKWYGSAPRSVDETPSSVRRIDNYPEPNLQPSPGHNRLPYEDLNELFESWNAHFEQMGWKFDPRTGQRVVPGDIVAQLVRRYKGTAATTRGAATQPKRNGAGRAADSAVKSPARTGGGR